MNPQVVDFETALLSIAVAGALWLVQRLARLAGLKIDTEQRAVLQDAMWWAARQAYEQAKAKGLDPLGPEARRIARHYLQHHTPGAVKHFRASHTELEEKLAGRLAEVDRAQPQTLLVEGGPAEVPPATLRDAG